MKRRSVVLPIDHGRDRSLWAVLIRDAHAAVAGDPAVARSHLGDTAVKAQLWNTPAPFPRGLVAPIFAKLVHAWARTPDAEARQRLAPLMLAAAGLTDELLDETALNAPTLPALLRDMAAAETAAQTAERQARLPYRED